MGWSEIFGDVAMEKKKSLFIHVIKIGMMAAAKILCGDTRSGCFR